MTRRSENDTLTYRFIDVGGERKALVSDQDLVSTHSLEGKRWIGLFLIHTLEETQHSTREERTDVFANSQSHLGEVERKNEGRLVSKLLAG